MSASKPEPVRPIRSLLRGLSALAALAGAEALSVTETARRARLPRTTTYRVLETLRQAGYVLRDDDDRYRLSPAGAAFSAAAPRPARNGAENGHAELA